MAREDEAGRLCLVLAPVQPTPSLQRNALQLGHARRRWEGRGPGVLMNFVSPIKGMAHSPEHPWLCRSSLE